MTKVFQVISVVLFTLILTGCGLNEDYIKSGEKRVAAIDKKIVTINKEVEAFPKNKLYLKFKKYADKEKLAEQMGQTKKYVELLSQYKRNINLYIKKDDSDDDRAILVEIRNASTALDKVTAKINSIKKRLSVYDSFSKNEGKLKSYVLAESVKLKLAIDILEKSIKTNSASFPKKATEIKSKSNTILSKAKADYAKYLTIKSEKDMVAFLQVVDYVRSSNAVTIKKLTAKTNYLESLNESKLKVLTDSKIETYFVGKVFSWDNYSDWSNEGDKLLRAFPVPTKLADLADSQGVGLVATYSNGYFGSANCKTDRQICQAFSHITSNKTMYSSDHTDAELWLNEVQYKYYFKYTTVENGVSKKSGWTKVSETEFNKFADFVGHEVYSKPYGSFSDEALTSPNPIGMSYVGNKKYGEWKENPQTGETFWSFYGKYMFISSMIDMFSGSRDYRYSRNDYNHWDRNYRNTRYTGREDRYSYGGGGSYYSSGYRHSRSSTGKTRTNYGKSGIGKSGIGKSGVNSTRTVRGVSSRSRGRGSAGGGK